MAQGNSQLSFNLAKANGITLNMGTGAASTGTIRVAIASDSSLILAAGVAEIGNVKNSGTFAVQATLQTALDTTMIGGVNIKEINAVTPLMGNGVTGTGSLRVTIASDNTAFSVNATLAAETTKVIGTIRNLGNVGAVMDGVNTAATAPANGILTLGIYNSTEPSPTTGQSVGIQLDSKGRQRIVLMDAAGNTRGANIDSSNRLSVSVDAFTATNASVNMAQMNGVTVLMGNGVTGTGSQRVTLASDGTAISTTGFMSVKFDQTTPGTTNAVSIAQIAGTTILNGGVAGSQSIGGTVATNVAINANPINLGAQGVSSENSAVTTARQVQLVADLVGKLIVLPYANPENFVSGVTVAITDTTSTSLIAAPAAGLRNYITHIIATNSHATVSTFVSIRDGSGGTIIYEGYALAAGGGFSITLPTPLRQPTTATAIHCKCETTGANVIVSATGYKGI